MSWALQLVLAILVVGVIAGVVIVVVGGHGAPLAEEYDDRPDVRVPRDRPLGGEDLRRARFTTALRGYRTSEVDALLKRLATQLEEQHSRPDDAKGLPDWSAPGDSRDEE